MKKGHISRLDDEFTQIIFVFHFQLRSRTNPLQSWVQTSRSSTGPGTMSSRVWLHSADLPKHQPWEPMWYYALAMGRLSEYTTVLCQDLPRYSNGFPICQILMVSLSLLLKQMGTNELKIHDALAKFEIQLLLGQIDVLLESFC